MAYALSFSGSDPLAAWVNALKFVAENGVRRGSIVELNHLTIVMKPAQPLTRYQLAFYRKIVGDAAWQRIQMIYTRGRKLNWKPSYIQRLIEWRVDEKEIDQLEIIRRKALRHPGSKTLSCTVFSPTDANRFISASVPCLLSLDFKIREGRVHLAAFFRSQDTFRFFLGDYHHLALLSRQLVSSLNWAGSKYEEGDLIFHLCSAHFASNLRHKFPKIPHKCQQKGTISTT